MRHGDEMEVRSTQRGGGEVAIVRACGRLLGRLFATRGRRELALFAAVEGQVQRALDSGVSSFLLSNLYLAAQQLELLVLSAPVKLPGCRSGAGAHVPREPAPSPPR